MGLQFSVVVPTRHRAEQLAECLDALDRMETPRGAYEVVVVEDGGERARGPAAARNEGAGRARAPVLAFLDDDCRPARDWLTAHGRRLAETPDAMVGGRVVNALERNRYAAASQLLVDYLCGYYNGRPGDGRFLTSNNLAVRADVFERVGGFDERFGLAGGEDRELVHRTGRLGRSVVYAPEAVVHHHHRLGARGFWRQHFRYGRGAVQYRRATGARGVRLEPLRFYANLVAYPWRRESGGELALSGLLALSQVANAAGFAYEQVSGR